MLPVQENPTMFGEKGVSAARALVGADRARILAVDDDLLSVKFLEAHIDALGHDVITASNGVDALNILEAEANEIDVVLMDQMMPEMDGITAVKRMKDDPRLRSIPVVMVTGADQTSDVAAGLAVGVFYYLTKPVDEGMLRSVLAAAVREACQSRLLVEELGKHRASFHLIQNCRFQFRTLENIENLAPFIANCFPDPKRVISGLGELMINAVEHGIAKIGYDQKTQLLNDGIWRAEISRRLRLTEGRNLFAHISIVKKFDGTFAVVEDPGIGFDWKRYLTIDPSRAGDNHGRGIAQARTRSFDRLQFNAIGNKVTGFVSGAATLDW